MTNVARTALVLASVLAAGACSSNYTEEQSKFASLCLGYDLEPETFSHVKQFAGKLEGLMLETGTFHTRDGTVFCQVEQISQQVVVLKLNGKALVSLD